MITDMAGENRKTDFVITLIVMGTCVPVLLVLIARLIHPSFVHRVFRSGRLRINARIRDRAAIVLEQKQESLQLTQIGMNKVVHALDDLIADGRIFNTHGERADRLSSMLILTRVHLCVPYQPRAVPRARCA